MKTLIFILSIALGTGLIAQETPKASIKKQVKVKDFYKNGVLKEKGQKKRFEKVFKEKNGKQETVQVHYKHGKWTEYYDNGQKKRILRFERGEVAEVIKEWDDQGNLISTK